MVVAISVDEFVVQDEPPPPRFVVKAKDKPKVVKCINAIQELLGRGGKYWIKGEYHRKDDLGIDSFCLVGATQKANGPYENAARLAIGLAIDKRKRRPDGLSRVSDFSEDTIVTFNDSKTTTWADVKAVLAQARQLVLKADTH